MPLAKIKYQVIRYEHCNNCGKNQLAECHYLDNGKVEKYCLYCLSIIIEDK